MHWQGSSELKPSIGSHPRMKHPFGSTCATLTVVGTLPVDDCESGVVEVVIGAAVVLLKQTAV